MGCAWWIIFLFVVLLIVGYLYLKIVDILKRVKAILHKDCAEDAP